MLSSLQQQAAANPYLAIGAAFEEQRRLAASMAAASSTGSTGGSNSGGKDFSGQDLGQNHAQHDSSSRGTFAYGGIDGSTNLPGQNMPSYASPALPPHSASGPPWSMQLQNMQAFQKMAAMNAGGGGSNSFAGHLSDASNRQQGSAPRFILPAHDNGGGGSSGLRSGQNVSSVGMQTTELEGRRNAAEKKNIPGVYLGGSKTSSEAECGPDGGGLAETTTRASRTLDDDEARSETERGKQQSEIGYIGEGERDKDEEVEDEKDSDAQGKHLRRPSQLSVATLLAEVEGAKVAPQDASYASSAYHYPPLGRLIQNSAGPAGALAALAGNNGLSNNVLGGTSGGSYDNYSSHERHPSAPGFEAILAQTHGFNNADPLAEQLRTAPHGAVLGNALNGITDENSSRSSSSGYVVGRGDGVNSIAHERRPSAVEVEQYLAQIQAATEHLQQQQHLQQLQQIQQLQQLHQLNQLQQQLQQSISGGGGSGGQGDGTSLDYSSLLFQLTQAPQFNVRSEVAPAPDFHQHEQQLQQLHLQQQLQLLQQEQDAASASHLNRFALSLTGHPFQSALGQLATGNDGSATKTGNKRARSTKGGVGDGKSGKRHDASRQNLSGSDNRSSSTSNSEVVAPPSHRRHVSAPVIVGSRSGSLTPPLILPGARSQSFLGSSSSSSNKHSSLHAMGAVGFAANPVGPPPGLNLADGIGGNSSSSSAGAMDRLGALLHMASDEKSGARRPSQHKRARSDVFGSSGSSGSSSSSSCSSNTGQRQHQFLHHHNRSRSLEGLAGAVEEHLASGMEGKEDGSLARGVAFSASNDSLSALLEAPAPAPVLSSENEVEAE